MIFDMTKRQGGSLSGWTTDGIADASEPNGALILGVSEVKDYAFYGRVAITSVSGSSVTKVKTSAFAKCSALTTFDFPNATSLEQNAFAQCVGLTSVHSPKATILTQTCFAGCTNLTTIVMPRCGNVQYNSSHNTALSALDIGSSDVAPSHNGIQAGAFGTVNNFNVLILRHAAIMPLGNISAFANTPFKSGALAALSISPNRSMIISEMERRLTTKRLQTGQPLMAMEQ